MVNWQPYGNFQLPRKPGHGASLLPCISQPMKMCSIGSLQHTTSGIGCLSNALAFEHGICIFWHSTRIVVHYKKFILNICIYLLIS